MAYSIQDYTSDGVFDQFELNFAGGYIAQEHVKAEHLSAETGLTVAALTVSFINSNTVVISPVPVAGDIIRIYRDTPKDLPLVDFADGAPITERTLDKLAQQAVFIAAEMVDRFDVVADKTEAALTAAILAQELATAANLLSELADAKATTALSNSAQAVADSAVAVAAANSATLVANAAEALATTALATANTALANSEQAISTADAADLAATQALATANSIAGIASNALDTATQALAVVGAAQTTANNALATANSAFALATAVGEELGEVVSKVSGAVAYTIPGPSDFGDLLAAVGDFSNETAPAASLLTMSQGSNTYDYGGLV